MQTNCKNKMTTFFKPNCNVDCDCSNCQEGKIPTIMIRINNNSSTLKCLNYLSSNLWMTNRVEIANEVSSLYRDNILLKKDIDHLDQQCIFKSDTKNVLIDCFKGLDKKNKQIILDKYKINKNIICEKCLDICAERVSCIHTDCPGLCAACFEQHDWEINHECPACHKSQSINCPVCLLPNDTTNLCKSEHCNHYICWKCYGEAYRSKNPISKCPMCRVQFNKHYDINGITLEISMDA